MPDQSIKTHGALKWRTDCGTAASVPEPLAVEEPLEIRLGGRRFTLTMRTPGHDRELAAGFLLAEGFINSRRELGEVRGVTGSKGEPEPNAVDVILAVPAAGLRERLKRNFTVSSSCGVCGKTSIESIQRRIAPLTDNMKVSAEFILTMPGLMRDAQQVFSATGGLHAAALFRTASPLPELAVIREDVGRHNAVDKVIGRMLMRDALPLGGHLLFVSGRASFEIVQKALFGGIPIVAAVSAPSSLAIDLAGDAGITLVGFVRGGGFNIYTHPERVSA
jgi:FdhD protein